MIIHLSTIGMDEQGEDEWDTKKDEPDLLSDDEAIPLGQKVTISQTPSRLALIILP